MKTFRIILMIVNIILFIHSLYFGLFAIIPFFFKEKKRKTDMKKHKFCILIAARNEELVLKPLIESIKKQNYDKDKYKICVLPNNCIDKTKEIALNLGCIVLEPNIKTKTKGEVLNFAFESFKNDDSFDTYIILDADNVLDNNYLKEINNKLNEGYKIVQGFRDTKNLYQNLITGSYALFFYLQNLFLYESRKRINQSCTVNGTGFAVLKSYIDNIEFHSCTSTEDIEFTCVAAINKEKIGYANKAIFYDEQVSNFNVSIKQRKRWIQGSMQVWKQYKNKLIKEIKRKNNFQLTEMFFILTLPINQALAFPLLILSYIFIIPLPFIIVGIIVGYIGEIIVSIFLTLYFKKNLFKLIPAILFFPIFHISWIPIYIYSLFNSKNTWEEIKHSRVMNLEEILKE